MKILKIILAVAILYASGSEFANAGKQIGSFFNPGILLTVLLLLTLTTWLFGSAVAKEKLRFKSLVFLKYFMITLLAFIIVVYNNL